MSQAKITTVEAFLNEGNSFSALVGKYISNKDGIVHVTAMPRLVASQCSWDRYEKSVSLIVGDGKLPSKNSLHIPLKENFAIGDTEESVLQFYREN